MYKTRNLPNTRIEVADALRGIAVIGIILFHSVEHFNIFPAEPAVHTLPCDQLVSDVLAWLLSGKMYGIFAMLFGLSFFIQNDNQQQMGRSFSGRFAWRMFLLLCFGIVNMSLYDGDILMVYAFVGLILIPISFLPSKAVWIIIALLAIQPVEIYRLISGWDMDTDKLWGLADYMGDVHMKGTFLENTWCNFRWGFIFVVKYYIYSGRLTQIMCLFILGMQLGRQRFFYNEGRNLRYWHIILCVSAVMSAVLTIVDLGKLSVWLTPIRNFFILFMIVSAVVSAWYAFKGFRNVLHHLCIFGRMSLTNYFLQSILGSFIFCGFGLACYHWVGITYAVLIGVGMIVVQYTFCRIWFRNHERGPLEGLWRKLTWI